MNAEGCFVRLSHSTTEYIFGLIFLLSTRRVSDKAFTASRYSTSPMMHKSMSLAEVLFPFAMEPYTNAACMFFDNGSRASARTSAMPFIGLEMSCWLSRWKNNSGGHSFWRVDGY